MNAVLLIELAEAKARLAIPATCTWNEDSNGIWYTACDKAWEMYESTPEQSGYKFCPSCGRQIAATRYIEPEPDDDEVQP